MNTHEKLVALKTIATREILRFSRIWIQTVLPPVITTALYFVIFGNLIGPRIGKMDGFVRINVSAVELILSPAYDVGADEQGLRTVNLNKLNAIE